MLKDKKVLVAEKIDDGAVEVLRESCQVDLGYDFSRETLLETIGDYEGIIIRSGTAIDVEFLEKAQKLKIVGRAGNGTDNINIPEATKRGIIVANTPESNTMSAAELSCSHILSQSRNVVEANNYIKGGKWDRNPFKGNEVYEKTLGIVGLGRIGSLVAERMRGFGMKVIAYDPYISDSRFKRYKVEKKETLEALIQASDYISVHTPRNNETHHMINDDHLALMKKGVRLTNVARGGIIAEKTILKGLEEGIIQSAAIDVHEEEPCFNNPLFAFDQITVTPHLGASTIEAQRNVGMNVVEQVIYALQGEIVPNALNLPTLSRSELKSTKPYIELVEKLGKMYYQLTHDPVEMVKVEYFGQLANKNNKLITLSFLKGLLDTVIDTRVNYINADLIAEQRGIIVREKSNEDYYNGYTEFIRITVQGKNEEFSFGGNLSAKNEGRLVEFNGYEIDITPDKYMYIVQNMDLPGVVGHVGTALGETNTNVATMQLGRNQAGDKAMMILNVDNKPNDATVNKLLAIDNIFWAKKVIL